MFDLSVLANWSQIISLIVAAIAVVVAIRQNRLGKNKPALTYIPSHLSSPTLIHAGRTLESELEIRYKGRKIQDLRVMQITLKNTTGIPIRKNHIVKPISFTFESGSELLTHPKIDNSFPSDLHVDFTINAPNMACLNFELFNPDDELTVEFVWSGPRAEPKVSARIEGIIDVNRVERDELTADKVYLFLSQIFVTVILLGVIFGIPIALLTGSGLVSDVLNPKDFFGVFANLWGNYDKLRMQPGIPPPSIPPARGEISQSSPQRG
ncbi:MAG: hypothetical protein R3264_16910, partial [Anaerolineae bacterium]|nr:hypothetical protein [Anaerolineae bacterium]